MSYIHEVTNRFRRGGGERFYEIHFSPSRIILCFHVKNTFFSFNERHNVWSSVGATIINVYNYYYAMSVNNVSDSWLVIIVAPGYNL